MGFFNEKSIIKGMWVLYASPNQLYLVQLHLVGS